VSETFFDTLGIPILSGRGLSAADVEGAPPALVANATFVRNYFPNENPLGRIVKIHGIEWQVVGVCADAKYEDLTSAVPPTVYMSFRQYTLRYSVSFYVRTVLPPLALTEAVRKTISAIDPSVPVAAVTTQGNLRDKNIGRERLLAALCATLGGIALLLACIGLYGLMAYHVTRRTNEIAIRMAIGAQPHEVARAILREALILALIGIGIGLPAVLFTTRVIESHLYGISANDPLTLAAVVGVLVVVALLAAWLPARRATRVDPMIALRAE
jgi:predicted permease